jgi:hypothetical protein
MKSLVPCDEVRARLCCTLLAPVWGDELLQYFTPQGPTERAWTLYRTGGLPLGRSHQLMFLTAMALWTGNPNLAPPIASVMFELEAPQLELFARVLAELAAARA